MKHWKMKCIKTGLYSLGGINAEFSKEGRAFKNKVGVKGTLFHYVYGFRIDEDGTRRFHPRGIRTVDNYEAICFEHNKIVEVIAGRALFTRNQLLNKEDRILTDLSSAELKAELKKQY
jgi:hypothetical protein